MDKKEAGKQSVGIDLGTTYSSIAYVDARLTEDRQFLPRPIALRPEFTILGSDEGDRMSSSWAGDGSIFCIPSRVLLSAGGSVEVDVYGNSERKDQEIVENFKSKLSEPGGDNEALSHWKAAVALIKFLKERAEAELGEVVQRAVIAIPSKPGLERVFGKLLDHVGLGVDIVDETVAALCYVDFLEGGVLTYNEKRVMVIDYGGGTCNVTIAEVSYKQILLRANRTLTPLATAYDWVGGNIIDEALVDWVRRKHEEAVADLTEKELMAQVRRAKERTGRVYHRLEENDMVKIIKNRDEPSWTRQTFDDVIRDSIQKITKPVEEALRKARLKTGEKSLRLDFVFLVGGSSNLPLAKTVLEEFFERLLNEASQAKEESLITGMPDIRNIRPSPSSVNLRFEEGPVEVIRDPRLAVSCGAALHNYLRRIGRDNIVDDLPEYVDWEIPGEEPKTLFKKGERIPTRKPRSRLIRMTRSESVKLTLYSRKDKESSRSFLWEKEFGTDFTRGALVRVDAEVDICRRVTLSVRPFGRKEPEETDVSPSTLRE